MEKPAFADQPSLPLWKRRVLGVVCAFVAVGVIVYVCDFLERFKEVALGARPTLYAPLNEKKLPSTIPPSLRERVERSRSR